MLCTVYSSEVVKGLNCHQSSLETTLHAGRAPHLDFSSLGELPHERVAIGTHSHDAVSKLSLEQARLALDAPKHKTYPIRRLVMVQLLRFF